MITVILITKIDESKLAAEFLVRERERERESMEEAIFLGGVGG